jgi:hypothetical protein
MAPAGAGEFDSRWSARPKRSSADRYLGGGRAWPRAAFKRRFPAPISSRCGASIPAKTTGHVLKTGRTKLSQGAGLGIHPAHASIHVK